MKGVELLFSVFRQRVFSLIFFGSMMVLRIMKIICAENLFPNHPRHLVIHLYLQILINFHAISVGVTSLYFHRFSVGDIVEAKQSRGYKRGTIIRLWDEGNPYRIRLDNKVEVWGHTDDDSLVRAPRGKGASTSAEEKSEKNVSSDDE